MPSIAAVAASKPSPLNDAPSQGVELAAGACAAGSSSGSAERLAAHGDDAGDRGGGEGATARKGEIARVR
jgi:hypothetical protein